MSSKNSILKKKCIAKVYISANIHVYCLLLQLKIFCCVENSIVPGGYL